MSAQRTPEWKEELFGSGAPCQLELTHRRARRDASLACRTGPVCGYCQVVIPKEYLSKLPARKDEEDHVLKHGVSAEDYHGQA